MSIIFDSSEVLRAISVGVGIAIAVSSAEMIVAWREISLFIGRSSAPTKFSNDQFLNSPFVLVAGRLAFALWLVVAAALGHSQVLPITMLTALTVCLAYFRVVGIDGSDQLQSITVIGLCFANIFQDNRVSEVILYFFAFQIVLAYATAGLAKALSPYWRNGDVLGKILNTYSYGAERPARFLLSHKRHNLAATYFPIVFLTTFPLIFVLNSDMVLYGYLLAGLLFHAGNAILMGLNNFLLTFPVLYPALVYTHARIHLL